MNCFTKTLKQNNILIFAKGLDDTRLDSGSYCGT